MAEIKNLKSLLGKLEKLRLASEKHSGSVIVGYNAAYALYVHENVEMKWKGLPRDHTRWSGKPGKGGKKKRKDLKQPRPKGFYWDPQARGQAKFLEQPARELQSEFKGIINGAMARGATLVKALRMVGLELQAESQKLVPVDTGNLKGSAFTIEE